MHHEILDHEIDDLARGGLARSTLSGDANIISDHNFIGVPE